MTNYAENQKRQDENPTKRDLEKMASDHVGYSWSRRPNGGWNEEQVAYYNQQYDDATLAAKGRYADIRTTITPTVARDALAKAQETFGSALSAMFTEEECSEIRRVWVHSPYGSSSFASTVNLIAQGFFIGEYEYNLDYNPESKRKLAQRVYRCTGCGGEIVTTTNHSSACYPNCRTGCYQIVGSRGVRLNVMTTHEYVRLADPEKDGKREYGIVKEGKRNLVR